MEKSMKKITFLLVLFCLVMPAFSASKTKTQYVAIDSAPLKAKPAASAKKIGSIEYASAVNILKEDKSWVYVQLVSDTSVEGWLPASALTSKKIKDKSSAASANADEIALAGKGFNSTIEAVYADQYNMSFDVVNYIETLAADQEETIVFAKEGLLNDGGAE